MACRIAAVMALIAFALCLLVGGFQAENTFSTAVVRALTAMAATFVIGLILGAMGRKMLDENLRAQEAELRKNQSPSAPSGR